MTGWLAEVESRTQGSRPRPRTQKKSEAKAQGQPFRGQTLSRPRTGMLEAKAKDQGTQSASALQKKKKKKGLHKNFSGDLQKKKKKKKKKGLHKNFSGDLQNKKKIFQAISTKKRFPKNFSTAPHNFNFPKNSAVLEPRTGQFSRT